MTIAEQQEWLRRHLDRHRISRRTALKGAASVLAALAATPAPGALAGCARAGGIPVGVVGRHLALGPDPSREMAIAAELTAAPAGRILIDLGPDVHYGHTIEAEVRELVSMVPQQDGSIRAADQFYVHALAEGLFPGGTFHYRIRLADGRTTPDATFTTAPGRTVPAPFRFTAFGDQGVSTPPADMLVERIAEQQPAFHLLAGDICYADPTGMGLPVKNNAPKSASTGFDNFDPTVWTQYFGLIEKSARADREERGERAVAVRHGQPRHGGALRPQQRPRGAAHGYAGLVARLDLPRSGPPGCPSVYSMAYGNVGIVSIDTNDLSHEIPTNAGYSGGAQLIWLTRQLADFRADPTVDFVVAFFHHCAYATGSLHASDGGVRGALAPLFDRFTLDLVVQGHNHQYERTDPIRGGVSTRSAPDGAIVDAEKSGTTYICCGSGGRPGYGWQPGETDRYRGVTGPDSGTVVASYVVGPHGATAPETLAWSQARYHSYAFLAVDVAPASPGQIATMSVRAITHTGAEIDRVNLVRIAGRGGAGTASTMTPSY